MRGARLRRARPRARRRAACCRPPACGCRNRQRSRLPRRAPRPQDRGRDGHSTTIRHEHRGGPGGGWRRICTTIGYDLAPDAAVHHRHGRRRRALRGVDRPAGRRSRRGQRRVLHGDARPALPAGCDARGAAGRLRRSRRVEAASTVCKRYFVEPAGGSDQFIRLGLGLVELRFRPLPSRGARRATRHGTQRQLVFFTKAELDMLEAEGISGSSNFAAAAALINVTRSEERPSGDHGLQRDPPVPGGASCVPKVPVGAELQRHRLRQHDGSDEVREAHRDGLYALRAHGSSMGAAGAICGRERVCTGPVPYQDLQARGTSPIAASTAPARTGNDPDVGGEGNVRLVDGIRPSDGWDRWWSRRCGGLLHTAACQGGDRRSGSISRST